MAGTCIITGEVLNLDGTPNSDVQIKAWVDSTCMDQGGQLVGEAGVTSKQIDAFTEDDGTFSITLLRGAKVRIEIEAIHLRKYILVPDAETALFSDLV
jgi:hypothetical protein